MKIASDSWPYFWETWRYTVQNIAVPLKKYLESVSAIKKQKELHLASVVEGELFLSSRHIHPALAHSNRIQSWMMACKIAKRTVSNDCTHYPFQPLLNYPSRFDLFCHYCIICRCGRIIVTVANLICSEQNFFCMTSYQTPNSCSSILLHW